ncbi:uncharacterized protein UBRO2_02810 [Ustilago bromivora]|uniref:CASTOR ACT domain-containing protein n=1 Tax=Ustilago bromivora TaxID=307758 RepID=A0A8H8QLW2_9BASI|nr:uncharacterized protein UBRO2_02810 [Ustilago bromivora]
MSVDASNNINDKEAARDWQSGKSQYPNLDVLIQPDAYMLARLPPTAHVTPTILELLSKPVDPKDTERFFCTVSPTQRELSILVSTSAKHSWAVLEAELNPNGNKAESDGFGVDGPWRAFRIRGPMEFRLVGVLLEFSKCLAAPSISIFAVSTWDTDCICVKGGNFSNACQALKDDGWNLVGASD